MKKSEFISIIAPLIVEEGKKRGYSVFSTVIAQAIIESNWGQSGLARYNNFFGLKCGSRWKGSSVNMKTKEEYTPGTLTTIKDNFRTYDSVAEGICGYYNFISTKRYKNLKTSRTALEYATNLKKDGYATSSTYVNTLMKTVEIYGLTKYDCVTEQVVNDIDTIAREVIAGKWGNGIDRRNRLHAAGYDYTTVQRKVNEILRRK